MDELDDAVHIDRSVLELAAVDVVVGAGHSGWCPLCEGIFSDAISITVSTFVPMRNA